MKNFTLLTISILFLLTSCSKDNAAAKKLDGSWNVTSLKVNSSELISANSSAEMVFSDIDANTGRYSIKLYALTVLVSNSTGSFTISDDGTRLSLEDDSSVSTDYGLVTNLTNSDLTFSFTDTDGDTTVVVAEKE